MLAKFRALSQTPLAKGLMVLILLAFLGFGIQGVGNVNAFKDTVVTSGSREMSSEKFRRIFENYRDTMTQQQGQAIPLETYFQANVDGRILQELAMEESLLALFEKSGIRSSDRLIAEKVRDSEGQFINPVSGRFDITAYRNFLGGQGLTPEAFEDSLRDQMAEADFESGIMAGLEAPYALALLAGQYDQDSRTLHYFVLTPADLGPITPPKDSDIVAFMKANASRLIRPEMRVIHLARFSAHLLGEKLVLDPAEVRKTFETAKEEISSPEKRSSSELLLKTEQQAKEASQRLKQGQSPDIVAKALRVAPPIELHQAPKGAIADAKLGDIAFGLKLDEVSGPVKGNFGWAVIKVLEIIPKREAKFEEERPKIEAELRQKKSEEQATRLAKDYSDLRAKGVSFTAAIEKLGLPNVQLPPMTDRGETVDGGKLPLPPKLLSQAFSMPKGGETEVAQDAGTGEYYAIRVEDIKPKGPFSLDEVRVPLGRQLLQDQIVQRLKVKSEAVLDQIRKGSPDKQESIFTGAAAASHAKIESQTLARHDRGNKASGVLATLNPDFFEAIFAAKPKDVLSVPTSQGLAIVKVDGTSTTMPETLINQGLEKRSDIARSVFNSLGSATREAAFSLMKTKMDFKRARLAAGGDPNSVNSDGTKPFTNKAPLSSSLPGSRKTGS